MRLVAVALLALTLGGSAAAYDPYTGDIYVVSVAGGHRHALTDAVEQEYFPALSPNGRRLAYVRDAEPDPQVWLMNPDGSGQRILIKCGDNRFEYDVASYVVGGGRDIAAACGQLAASSTRQS